MKLAFSTSSLLAYSSGALLLLGFSIPLVAPTFASNADGNCKIPKPPSLKSANDFVGMGRFQEGCLKDSQAAVASFTQAINLNPKAEEPYYHRAKAYAALGNYQAAVADYTEVIKQNTGDNDFSWPAYWNRARAYEKLGEKQKAISDLNQVINRSNGPFIEAQVFRANMYRDLGDKENAIADYKVAQELLIKDLNGAFGTSGLMQPEIQETLDKVRNQLSSMGVAISKEPVITTGRILKSIANVEVERALNLVRFKPEHPINKQFDTKLEDLYKQLANSQPQAPKWIVHELIANTAYSQIESLEKEKQQLIKKFAPEHPEILLINNQTNQLKALKNNHETQFNNLTRSNQQ